MHGQWLPNQQSQVGAAVDASQLPGEAGCPLCVAMHSTLPVAAAVPAAEMVADKPMRAQVAAQRVPDEVWHFAGFSRPPPSEIR